MVGEVIMSEGKLLSKTVVEGKEDRGIVLVLVEAREKEGTVGLEDGGSEKGVAC